LFICILFYHFMRTLIVHFFYFCPRIFNATGRPKKGKTLWEIFNWKNIILELYNQKFEWKDMNHANQAPEVYSHSWLFLLCATYKNANKHKKSSYFHSSIDRFLICKDPRRMCIFFGFSGAKLKKIFSQKLEICIFLTL